MMDSSVDIPRPQAADIEIIPPSQDQASNKRKKSGEAPSAQDSMRGYSLMNLEDISLDMGVGEVRVGTRGDPLDPVLIQRIKEHGDYVELRLDRVQGEIDVEEQDVRDSVRPNLAQRLFTRGRSSGPIVNDKLNSLRLYQDIVRHELKYMPERIELGIRANRRSRELYRIMQFLGDDPPYGRDDYWYDSINVKPSVGRRFNDSYRKIMDDSQLSRVSEYDFGKIVLYDTSDPQPQVTRETLVDAFIMFGFAVDASPIRDVAAMQADTGISQEPLKRFEKGAFGTETRFGMLNQEGWIDTSPDGISAKGFLHIEGDQDFEPRRKAGGSQVEGMNPALSELCRAWGISHLSADLVYLRTETGDVKIVVELRKPTAQTDQFPRYDEVDPVLINAKNITPLE